MADERLPPAGDDLPPPLAAGTALVVVGDPQTGRLLRGRMEAQGFRCEVARDVDEARSRLETFTPDVVVLDVRLPGEPGIVLAHELAEDPAAPALIVVSNEDDAEIARIALDAGTLAYVTRPLKRHELEIAIRIALRRRADLLEGRALQIRLEARLIDRSALTRDALRRLRAAHEETALRLSKVVECRDPESGSHIERMSHYCALLATGSGFDPESIKVASRLHDLGKFAIPESILLKPGPLTADERADMERHAEIGHRLLMDSGIVVLEQAATIAWTHHERFDGSGYPRRLAGKEIPLIGRIAAVADVFEALTSDRVYRTAIPVDDAIATLVAQRGSEFDPEVVDRFVAAIDAVRAIRMRFAGGRVHPPESVESAVPDTLVTLQLAAGILGVSPGRLRRWSDEGQIEAVRTTGGHRRFSSRAVHQLALERRIPAGVRPIEPPRDRLPLLAGCLRDQGQQLASAAAISLYRGRPDGWFNSEDAGPLRERWLRELEHSCDSGSYAGALHASDVLMRLGHEHGASLLERHSYLERFSRGALQALAQAGAGRQEAAAGRRLFGAIQQAHLSGHL